MTYSNEASSPKKSLFQILAKLVKLFECIKRSCITCTLLCKLNHGTITSHIFINIVSSKRFIFQLYISPGNELSCNTKISRIFFFKNVKQSDHASLRTIGWDSCLHHNFTKKENLGRNRLGIYVFIFFPKKGSIQNGRFYSSRYKHVSPEVKVKYSKCQ